MTATPTRITPLTAAGFEPDPQLDLVGRPGGLFDRLDQLGLLDATTEVPQGVVAGSR